MYRFAVGPRTRCRRLARLFAPEEALTFIAAWIRPHQTLLWVQAKTTVIRQRGREMPQTPVPRETCVTLKRMHTTPEIINALVADGLSRDELAARLGVA